MLNDFCCESVPLVCLIPCCLGEAPCNSITSIESWTTALRVLERLELPQVVLKPKHVKGRTLQQEISESLTNIRDTWYVSCWVQQLAAKPLFHCLVQHMRPNHQVPPWDGAMKQETKRIMDRSDMHTSTGSPGCDCLGRAKDALQGVGRLFSRLASQYIRNSWLLPRNKRCNPVLKANLNYQN